jgi:hypothetical protein
VLPYLQMSAIIFTFDCACYGMDTMWLSRLTETRLFPFCFRHETLLMGTWHRLQSSFRRGQRLGLGTSTSPLSSKYRRTPSHTSDLTGQSSGTRAGITVIVLNHKIVGTNPSILKEVIADSYIRQRTVVLSGRPARARFELRHHPTASQCTTSSMPEDSSQRHLTIHTFQFLKKRLRRD